MIRKMTSLKNWSIEMMVSVSIKYTVYIVYIGLAYRTHSGIRLRVASGSAYVFDANSSIALAGYGSERGIEKEKTKERNRRQ